MRLLMFSLLSMLVIACSRQNGDNNTTSTAQPSPIVAKLNGQYLRESDIDAEISALPESMRDIGTDSHARAIILQTLIRRKILSNRAIAMGLDKNPVVKQRIERARENILVQTLKEEELRSLPPPTKQDIESYFNKHKSDFSIPEQIHARHILVNSKKLAMKIYRQLKHGKDFSDLAAQYSIDDSTKTRGGDLNWFSRGTMVAKFEDAAFSLKKVGDISKPIHTKFGWHIIQLLGRHDATQKSLAEVHDEIVSILTQEAMDKWLKGITGHAHIQIFRRDYIQSKSSSQAPGMNGSTENP